MAAILCQQDLAQADGSLHSIAAIIYRDWVLTVDTVEARVTDAPAQRWSTEKLNTNELMLLVGLAVQSGSERVWNILPSDDQFAGKVDKLLRELHDRINEDSPWIDRETGALAEPSEVIGSVAREAIYYGADGFYLHQFQNLARHRFRSDQEWMLQNVGISIRPILEIATFIGDRITQQMDYSGRRKSLGLLEAGEPFGSLLINKETLKKRFGPKIDAFLAKFSTPAANANLDFIDPFSVNLVGIAPLIDIGDFIFVPSQHRLFQSVYESPFYWMIVDKAYRQTASRNRGRFLEASGAHLLKRVFGAEHVHQNVTLYQGKNIAGEIDVLVAYGEFVIVGQAKSKRVSLKARAGDKDALETDFKGAVQDPYGQALSCAEFIARGARCVTDDGRTIEFPTLPRLFPMVILSDHFPAAVQLSGILLKRFDEVPPVIWDLGFLDCVTRILASPIELIFYLQARSQHFDKVVSDSEFNFLGYHIRSKLAMPDDVDWMMLDRDFATVIDDFMIAADLKIQAQRPLGVLEQLDIPVISELFAVLKNGDPNLAGVVVDLYDFSGAALADLSATILDLREEVRETGKALKAFSIQTATGGLTYVVTRERSADAVRSAELLGAKHKYDTKSNRWYVIVDSIDTDLPVDGLLPLIWPWTEDEDEATRSEMVAAMFNSKQEAVIIGEAAARRAGTRRASS
ncbi:unnamed protein product [Ciceribacter sp. T2.26MG-112.2]|uniref:hypothetical protein n=1 Tax=Ciceribacter sp. T2.26MG-112.2 TaxID=3137154 RepID=UPI000E17639A|nr:hypothetical protein [Ciceribacter naphthalenivorans]SSC72749.1 unnamed protein product [Ciceribacter naphthalenivorans]